MNANLSVIREKGFAALTRELGAADAVRFLRQFDGGRGDYTCDRDALSTNETVSTIAARILQRKQGGVLNKLIAL